MNIVAPIKGFVYRELIKDVRNPSRFVVTLMFPLLTVGILGKGFDALGAQSIVPSTVLIFTGIIINEPFATASRAMLDITLEKEKNTIQSMFISPIPKILIPFGKILGVIPTSMLQVCFFLLIGVLLGVPLGLWQCIMTICVVPLVCFTGGAYGMFMLCFLKDSRSVTEIAQLFTFPQFFLAGVFVPISTFPTVVKGFAALLPLTHVIELYRTLFFIDRPEVVDKIVEFSLPISLIFLAVLVTLLYTVCTKIVLYREYNQ
jgi:ABC-2 type transport system permease protein